MNANVLSRFVKLMALATFVLVSFLWARNYFQPTLSGDFHVRQGDILLSGHDYAKALRSFDAALEETPNHRGALMGRAIVFMQTDRPAEAEAELGHLIDFLGRTLRDDDPTGKGALAAAYANRGILRDRQGRFDAALADYVDALKVDPGAVEGPGVADKILHNVPKWSTVRDRAEYLHQQLQLPEAERLLRVPELDAAQRMHKP